MQWPLPRLTAMAKFVISARNPLFKGLLNRAVSITGDRDVR
jgi:hypothetical protein